MALMDSQTKTWSLNGDGIHDADSEIIIMRQDSFKIHF